MIRVINTKHHTWRNYRALVEVERVAIRNRDSSLGKIERRLLRLKQRLEEKRIEEF